ncbi:MAG: sigma-54 dependent transcriptional regulator [Planctomycetes bacterium]|nr:sigma-54 dependent transcriptional regulator [Planctomycetota bacterium]
MKRHWEILIVDDEAGQRESMAAWLTEDGYEVDTAPSGAEALKLAQGNDYAIYVIDLKMPGGMDGIETMREIRKLRPEAAVLIVTAYATVDTAVTAIKEGAQDYLVKPINPQELSLQVDRIVKMRKLQRENAVLRRKLTERYTFHDIVSKSPTMHEIFELIRNVAGLKSTVLIQGESGTGKERIARAIHFQSDRRDKPFIAVPCTALAESLLESELFGHEKGAFTGAVGRRRGKFEMADGGTMLLDEIGDITPKLQVELLRVLQERTFYRVGGSEEVEVDVRVIAASNQNLQEAVHAGKFRDDLFYRLNVITIHIPPLRERLEDIPLLAGQFLESIAAELGKEVRGISDGALRVLMHYDWPGNVRELRNAVERAIVICRSHEILADDFNFLRQEQEERARASLLPNVTLREMEKRMVQAALQRTDGNIKAAADELGIDRSTLYEKIKRYGIRRPELEPFQET